MSPELLQESVWGYPRPPRIEDSADHVRVVLNAVTVANSVRTKRVLETSHPPVYYLPPQDVDLGVLELAVERSFCEWKGVASYFDAVRDGNIIRKVAWSYLDPTLLAKPIRGYIAFYPSRVDACFVNDERVTAQPGDFYGGWITSRIVGPFKGGPGTARW